MTGRIGCQLLRPADPHNRAAPAPPSGLPIRRLDHIQVVLDDDDRVSLALFPNGRFVYVNNTDSSITTLSVDPATGVLGLPLTENVASGGPLVFNTAGTVAYMAAPNSVAVIAFDIDPDTGANSTLQILQPLPEPNAVAVDPSGEFLFVSNQADNTLATFTIEAGRLAPFGTPVSLPGVPRGITIASLLV